MNSTFRQTIGRLLICAMALCPAAFAAPPPTVERAVAPIQTDSGLLAGKVLSSNVKAWFGVPYAQAPLRELRWRPPQQLSWSGVYNAERFAPQCIQPLRGSNINHYFGHEATSEDCLYLNIWAAGESKAGDDLPVIAWIYGGGFTIGSAAMPNYAGEGLASKGAVYVSISYRLGALGFLAHPELTAESAHDASGNYGFLDQVAALEWIQRNIERFGGDPNRVTIMGQSAGAFSVSYLQASPLSEGLFHGIVGMSGSAFMSRNPALLPLADAEKSGLAYEEALKVDSLQALRQTPADRILALQEDCQLGCSGSIRVGPIVDGYFMPEMPSEIFSSARQHDVPIVIGFTRDEGFSVLARVQTLDEYQTYAKQLYGDKAEELLRLYPATSDAEAARAARDAARDSTLGLGMRNWAETQTRDGKQPVFAFLFARVHPYTAGVTFADHDPQTAGAYHTADVPYWLQTLDSLNLFRETRTYTDYDRQLSGFMSDAILAFASRGNPSTGALVWPKFSVQDDKVVQLGRDTAALFNIIDWPNADKLAFFASNPPAPPSGAPPERRSRD